MYYKYTAINNTSNERIKNVIEADDIDAAVEQAQLDNDNCEIKMAIRISENSYNKFIENAAYEEELKHIVKWGQDYTYSRPYSTTSKERFDADYPDMDSLTPAEDEYYCVYKTTDTTDFFCNSIMLTASGTVTVEYGTVSNGAYVSEGTLETFSASTDTTHKVINFTTINHKYTVVRLTCTTHFRQIYVTNGSLTINGVSFCPQSYLGNNTIEIKANLPYFYGVQSNSYCLGNRMWLEKVTISNLGRNNTTANLLYGLFNGCYNLQEWSLPNLNTNNVKALSFMFYNCYALEEIDLTNWNFSNVVDLNGTFCYCYNVKKIKLPTLGNLTQLPSTFNSCYCLNEIVGYENFNTDNVLSCTSIFNYCYSLTDLDLSNWNITSKCTNISAMFQYCVSLKSLKISNWDLSKVTAINGLFNYCENLDFSNIIDKIENWNTSSVTNFSSVFGYCRKISKLDLSKWNLDKSTYFSSMFYGCYNLKEVTLPTVNLTSTSLIDFNGMFAYCYSIKEIDISMIHGASNIHIGSIAYYCFSVEKITLLPDNTTVKAASQSGMFYFCYNLKEIINFEKIDTTNATSLDYMFYYCYSLPEINLSNLNFGSELTTASSMFRQCYNLEEINLNGTWNNTKCTNLFYCICTDCQSLKKFTCNYNYNIGTNFQNAFNSCRSIKEINIPNVDLSKVTNASYASSFLQYNYNLEKIDIGSLFAINFILNSNYKFSDRSAFISFLDKLPTVTSSRTITLGSNKAALSAAEKTAINNKGWTIA